MYTSERPRSANSGFQPLQAHEPALLFRERPGGDEPYLEFADTDGFRCYIHSKALRQMAGWGQKASHVEVIGRLAGRRCTDGKGGYVLVERATLNRRARCGVAFVMTDFAAEDSGRREFQRKCRALDCVDWWHTHPSSLALFYSETDRQNQRTWSDPNAIGIVLNPALQGDVVKVFRGPHSIELRLVVKRGMRETVQSVRSGLESSSPVPPSGLGTPGIRVRPIYGDKDRKDRTSAKRATPVGVVTAISIASVALVLALLSHILLWTSAARPDLLLGSPRTFPDSTTEAILHREAPTSNTLPRPQSDGGASSIRASLDAPQSDLHVDVDSVAEPISPRANGHVGSASAVHPEPKAKATKVAERNLGTASVENSGSGALAEPESDGAIKEEGLSANPQNRQSSPK